MQKIQKMLMESIFEVFEKMYFVFLEPVDVDQGTYDMTASIGFQGNVAGEVKIFVSKGLAEKMVQNMLSIEDGGITTKLVEDCLKESANMICGAFLHKFDSSQVFNLTMPAFNGNPAVLNYTEQVPSVKLAFESERDSVGVSMSMTDQAV